MLDCIRQCVQATTCKAVLFLPFTDICKTREEEEIRSADGRVSNTRLQYLLSEGWIDVRVEKLEDWDTKCKQFFKEPELSIVYREQLRKDIDDLWNTTRKTFVNLKRAYKLHDSSTEAADIHQHRSKRNSLAVIAAPIVGKVFNIVGIVFN